MFPLFLSIIAVVIVAIIAVRQKQSPVSWGITTAVLLIFFETSFCFSPILNIVIPFFLVITIMFLTKVLRSKDKFTEGASK